MSRSTTWRSLCEYADEEFEQTANDIVQYEFSSRGRPENASDKNYGYDTRLFRKRGAPYPAEVVGSDDLTWNGEPLIWNGEVITWDD